MRTYQIALYTDEGEADYTGYQRATVTIPEHGVFADIEFPKCIDGNNRMVAAGIHDEAGSLLHMTDRFVVPVTVDAGTIPMFKAGDLAMALD